VTNVFYYLAKYPSQYAKLRAELSALVKPTADFNVNDVRDAPHLNGCINEALRIRPPVPSAIYRLTPPEGIMVGDQFIPGGVTVSSPMWTLGRCASTPIIFWKINMLRAAVESIYPQAAEFIPERWYSRPELLKTKDAFAPFSLGKLLQSIQCLTPTSLTLQSINP
jgi:cytochrome P450